MAKLEIKKIKGNKYVYIKDRVKVNNKSLQISIYVGRLGKITPERFSKKLEEYRTIRLKKFTEYWLKKRRKYLDDKKAFDLEVLHYNYQLFKKYYPDEMRRYEESVFARYVQGTTAIEGNTITLRQAKELLEHNITPAGKSLREVYEIINFRNLRSFLEECKGDISERLIKKMHAIIMENLLESAGNYRRIQVLIEKADHEPPPAFEVPDLMKRLVNWYRKEKKSMHPFELAVLLHTKFVTIHPFVDGNGRVARALMNFVLERNGYPTLYLGLEHRERYLDVVAEGSEGNYEPVVNFMCDAYIKQHKLILNEICGEEGKFPEMKELVNQFFEISKRF